MNPMTMPLGADDPAVRQGGPPLVLPRKKLLRVLAGLILIPAALFGLVGGVGLMLDEHPEPVAASVVLGVAAILVVLLVVAFRSEGRKRLELSERGVALTKGSGNVERLAWHEIDEVWLRAVKVRAGGLLGAAIGAAIDAARKKSRGLDDDSTSIYVRLVGNGGKLRFDSNFKGVGRAFERILAEVVPRMTSRAIEQARSGMTVPFGPLALSVQGLIVKKRAPIPFSEIEKLAIEKGRLVVKKKGSWLAAAAIPVAKIPNVFVLTGVFDQLAGGAVQARAERGGNLTSSQYV